MGKISTDDKYPMSISNSAEAWTSWSRTGAGCGITHTCCYKKTLGKISIYLLSLCSELSVVFWNGGRGGGSVTLSFEPLPTPIHQTTPTTGWCLPTKKRGEGVNNKRWFKPVIESSCHKSIHNWQVGWNFKKDAVSGLRWYLHFIVYVCIGCILYSTVMTWQSSFSHGKVCSCSLNSYNNFIFNFIFKKGIFTWDFIRSSTSDAHISSS
jgi:hypothetical protein